MTIRANHPNALQWRKMADIPMGWMRDHIDPTELEGHLAFHEPGSNGTMQLMEMRLDPNTLVAPHSHNDDEIFYVAEGMLHWGSETLLKGGSLYISAGTVYSFWTGPEPATLINFRARADHSFHPENGR